MKLRATAAALLLLLGLTAQAPPPRYAEGQVWEYKTRPNDAGSLLKIQKIEELAAFKDEGPVYHLSIIGLKFAHPRLDGTIAHTPVTRETLDASVTRLFEGEVDFPTADDGIAEWTRAEGGVFSLPVAEIVDLIEGTAAQGRPPATP